MEPEQTESRPQHSPKRASVLFQLTAFSSVLFIMTVLAMVAAVFGDQSAPAAKQFNRHVGKIIATEVGATLLLGFAAMTQDRRQTLADREKTPPVE